MTKKQIERARKLIAKGDSEADVAEAFGVSLAELRTALRGVTTTAPSRPLPGPCEQAANATAVLADMLGAQPRYVGSMGVPGSSGQDRDGASYMRAQYAAKQAALAAAKRGR